MAEAPLYVAEAPRYVAEAPQYVAEAPPRKVLNKATLRPAGAGAWAELGNILLIQY